MTLIDFVKHTCEPNWLTKKDRKFLKYGKPTIAVAFFCPSYKKYDVGFNTVVGNTTKRGLDFMMLLNKYVQIQLVFADVIVENFGMLTKEDFNDLNDCYTNFILEASKRSLEDYSLRLSDITDIPVAGIQDEIPTKYEKGLIDRERTFYTNMFGWNDEQIRKRLEILSGSYKIMGKYVKAKNGFIVMIENQYERGKLYDCPIIYPKKRV